jgi:hypothetical protein
MGTQDLLRLRQHTTMLDGRERDRCRRRDAIEFLQEYHTEDVVDVGLWRQGQLVGDSSNSFQHLEWPIEFGCQLAASRVC